MSYIHRVYKCPGNWFYVYRQIEDGYYRTHYNFHNYPEAIAFAAARILEQGGTLEDMTTKEQRC